ncbi:MAG: response regulator, partial [Burkholderiales bacterium]|nr:response regulator [Burkholderiales bacterium]
MLRTRSLRVVLLAELLVALAVVLGLWSLRRQTLDAEYRHLSSLAGAMAAQADATLDAAAAVLRATREELAEGLLVPGTEAGDLLLRARVAGLPRFRALAVTDATGRRIATSRAGVAGPGQVGTRDFFDAARDAPPGGLHIGVPYVAHSDGLPAIAVATDWRDRQGRFEGVVVLVGDPEFLDRDFPRLAPSPDTRMAIYRHDFALIADGPGDNTRDWASNALVRELWSDAEPERARAVTLGDDPVRLVAARMLSRSQLMLVVTRGRAEALAAWTDEAWLVGAFAASALLVTLLLSVRNVREQSLRLVSEAALAAEQARALRAFQAAQEGAWEWNPATQQSYLSPRMKELLGLARDAPAGPGLPMQEILHPDDVAPLRAAFAAHQEGGAPPFDQVFRVRRAEGGWRHIRTRGLALHGAQGVIFSGTAIDVSDEVRAREERAALEERLGRARRLEALGALAGGVAHDFNNVLAAVIGYGELAHDGAPAGSTTARRLDQVLQAGARGKALVERILAFSRGAPRVLVPMRLQPVVEEVLQLLAASLPPGVRLVRELHAADAVVRADATAVFEAVMNLCSNGVQAMPAGGALKVSLETQTVDRERTLFEGRLHPGRYACLRVEDEGRGIAADVLPRLFEPFFTTRDTTDDDRADAHRGTGLGLAVVHGVVLDLGGAIDVASAPGRGARFELCLPCVDDALPEPAPVVRSERVPLGDGQAVLVVDDEPALVELAEEMLASLGYEPFGVDTPAAALERFRDEPDRYALLLTDEVMPGLAGTALATAIHAIRPGLPVVLASAWGGPRLEQRAAAAGIAVRVAKPLTRAALARA